MTRTILNRTERFTLLSWGHGTAYGLSRLEAGVPVESVFVQGDDATVFDMEFRAMEAQFPERDTDDILGWLWSSYNELATPVIVTARQVWEIN